MAQANQARGSRNLPGAGSSTYADILYARLPNLTRATFSEQPEVLGCATRMLTGFPCVGPTTVLAEDVRAAVAALSKLGFVGLTERWTASVCLFHRTFGLPRPKRAQALNSRAGSIYGEAERGAARDPADEAVYAEAARVFAAANVAPLAQGLGVSTAASACHLFLFLNTCRQASSIFHKTAFHL